MRIQTASKVLGWAVVAAGMAALPARAAATGSITPTWAESHHPFTLALSGQSDKCAPVFSHQSYRLNAGKLVFSVLEQQRPGVLCTTDTAWAYRTEFDAPALDSGEYPVQVRWAQACEFDATPCPVAYMPQDVGNLRVTDSAALPYSFTPRSVRAGQDFHIRLRGTFNCGDLIKSATVDTARPTLRLNFLIEPHPEDLCIAPFPGIDFAVPALGAGGWEVYASRAPYCPPSNICPLALMAPQLAGALEVSPVVETVVPLRPETRAGPAGAGHPGFRSKWNGFYYDAAGKAMLP
ncbi:MAG: hypothetical protein JF616_03830 [Fibrobacteres bacterium]|nr:hypothetical protein [Fibrobacterota bacterium]